MQWNCLSQGEDRHEVLRGFVRVMCCELVAYPCKESGVLGRAPHAIWVVAIMRGMFEYIYTEGMLLHILKRVLRAA
jgi:hypothetical protein